VAARGGVSPVARSVNIGCCVLSESPDFDNCVEEKYLVSFRSGQCLCWLGGPLQSYSGQVKSHGLAGLTKALWRGGYEGRIEVRPGQELIFAVSLTDAEV
jgi:hypothetical protein